MPKKVPVIQVVLHRDGKQVAPEIGKAFDFTKEEIADLEQVRKGSLRDPVNEDPEAVTPKNARAAKEAEAAAGKDATKDGGKSNDI